ncbi:MAG: DUF58 domain-containing protein [Pseudanabaenaceae cyanobacterium bins.68]|nr:DUF58 domain-containing protein [Pseudanabaenaceae cyanobacterium bins.68]
MASVTRPRRKPKAKTGFWRWLEYRYARPEFGGSLLLSLAIFFFIAATNTLAGWLYVISGIIVALLLINLFLPGRLLAKLHLQRSPLKPISAGDQFWQELQIINTSSTPLQLIGVQDHIPPGVEPVRSADEQIWQELQIINTSSTPLGLILKFYGFESDISLGLQPLNHQTLISRVIESIAAQKSYRWCYRSQAPKRGLYQFDTISLYTSSPLGLCRSSRTRLAPQTLTVYPQVLPLTNCPIIDQLGSGELRQFQTWSRKPQTASHGMTKALRPYRWGDPIRLVHWRSSAKFGELRVRELEINPGGAELVIGIDLNQGWRSLDFEQAVVTAASLYFYAKSRNLEVKIWTGSEPDCIEQADVLDLLAKIQPTVGSIQHLAFPAQPLIWLTAHLDQLPLLPARSRTILWQAHNSEPSSQPNCLTVINNPSESPESFSGDGGILDQGQLNHLQKLLQTTY